MTRKDADRIADILSAIDKCVIYQELIVNQSSEPILMMANDAIERNLQIIGEAANHLSTSVTESLPNVPWPQIRGFRNILVHQYFGVDTSVIREVVTTFLPPFADSLKRYQHNAVHKGKDDDAGTS